MWRWCLIGKPFQDHVLEAVHVILAMNVARATE